MNIVALSVFCLVFCLVAALGLLAGRWRSGDLNRLQEWGLGGRRFGTIMSWFLLGGDIYTAYSFIAVPGLIFSTGALGFFAVPYLTIIYPLLFLVLPKLWAVSRHRGYVTSADFVRERFDSPALALLIAIVGICATMPYIALQIYGMEILLTVMGVPLEVSLFIAFAVLALYTYVSGLRAPALIAIVKDVCIWVVTIVAIVSITTRLGGFGAIFAAVHHKALINPAFHDVLPASSYTEYVTLALGSAFALLLYPHNLTGMLSTNSGKVVKRNAALLPMYTILLVMIGLLGYEAVAANVHLLPVYGANAALPGLLAMMFPSWFSGFAFATISVGALVPAAIMSIAAANLFTRNIYREYLRPHCNEREEASVAKTASLIVKFGALAVILWLPTKLAINFQLFSNFLIIQTLPAVFIALYTRWFHKYALIIGILGGLVVGGGMAIAENFASVYPLVIGGVSIPVYIAIAALIVNLALCTVFTLVFRLLAIPSGEDLTTPLDYVPHPVGVGDKQGTPFPRYARILSPTPPPEHSLPDQEMSLMSLREQKRSRTSGLLPPVDSYMDASGLPRQ
ncbi:MAG: sodium:solute symporter [Ktedonobacteraceae bacterium]|nr:sodium:solute symporter [Ktedonobacteraceae bacterium]